MQHCPLNDEVLSVEPAPRRSAVARRARAGLFRARPCGGHRRLVGWRDSAPVRQRYPKITTERLAEARAFAYGGSVIQDLGYFPFGSKRFTNIVHYIRSGDFVEGLIREAASPEELAFALGGLAHYACDSIGHPVAVNRVVPMMYPKLRSEFGERVLYVESPARHLMVEFAFDVLHVAGNGYAAQAYRDRIGFEVAKPLLERAFRATYGVDLNDLFDDLDLAIGTYRHAIGTVIPEITRLAWEDKQSEIRARTPAVAREDFVFSLTRDEYDTHFGTDYEKPSLLARIFYFLVKIVPKVGPLKPLAFEPLTADAERLFMESFETAHARFQGWVQRLRTGSLSLANSDLDTGQPPDGRVNDLVNQARADLTELLARRNGD